MGGLSRSGPRGLPYSQLWSEASTFLMGCLKSMTIGEGRQHGQNQTTWCAVPTSMGFSGKRSVFDKISTEKTFQIKKKFNKFLRKRASARSFHASEQTSDRYWQISTETCVANQGRYPNFWSKNLQQKFGREILQKIGWIVTNLIGKRLQKWSTNWKFYLQ